MIMLHTNKNDWDELEACQEMGGVTNHPAALIGRTKFPFGLF
jgi:hypothetical protein